MLTTRITFVVRTMHRTCFVGSCGVDFQRKHEISRRIQQAYMQYLMVRDVMQRPSNWADCLLRPVIVQAERSRHCFSVRVSENMLLENERDAKL